MLSRCKITLRPSTTPPLRSGSAQDEVNFGYGIFHRMMPDTMSLTLSEVEGRWMPLQEHPIPVS
jgi:hypothetical protein